LASWSKRDPCQYLPTTVSAPIYLGFQAAGRSGCRARNWHSRRTLAAFGEANKASGARGRKLKLSDGDDAYEPDCSLALTKKIEQDKILALVELIAQPRQ